MNLKYITSILIFVSLAGFGQGVNVDHYFADEQYHIGSDEYISGDLEKALETVNAGLTKVPEHKKLQELKKLLEQEKEQQEQNQDQQNQDQQNQDQQQQQQQQQDQENQEQQEQQQQEQQDQEKKEEEQTDNEEQQQEPSEEDQQKEIAEKLEEMNMSEEKAKMILEAMKNSEQQYLQQLKRKATKKNTGKPDW